PARLGVPMLALVFMTVAAWMAVNIRSSTPFMRVGVVAILLGAVSNGVAIAANGRMPYSLTAAAAAGLPAEMVTPKNGPSDRNRRLAFLGDGVPVPPLGQVVSPGDLLIGLGAAVAIAAAMRRRHRTDGEEVENDQNDQLEAGSSRGVPARLDRDAALH